MCGYAFLRCNIGQPRFQVAIPLWIPRLDNQSDGENSPSYEILDKTPLISIKADQNSNEQMPRLNPYVANKYALTLIYLYGHQSLK